ncbi:MAG: hypothetical protein QXE22_06630 [Candidatus Bathyarchaeia archaeon]
MKPKEIWKSTLGGIPLSVNQEPTAEEQFIAALESETLKTRYSVQFSKEIIASIIRKAPFPILLNHRERDRSLLQNHPAIL